MALELEKRPGKAEPTLSGVLRKSNLLPNEGTSDRRFLDDLFAARKEFAIGNREPLSALNRDYGEKDPSIFVRLSEQIGLIREATTKKDSSNQTANPNTPEETLSIMRFSHFTKEFGVSSWSE